MKGSVRQRGSKWQYRFRGPERDPSTGEYPWITKGGFHTKKEAWQACREAMAEADRGRVVKPSTRTVAQFFAEWFAAIEPSIDATTWQNWKDYADTYVIPRIGGERLQRLEEPQLLRLYGQSLAEGGSSATATARCTPTGRIESRRAKPPRLVRFPIRARRRSTQREQRFDGTSPALFRSR